MALDIALPPRKTSKTVLRLAARVYDGLQAIRLGDGG